MQLHSIHRSFRSLICASVIALIGNVLGGTALAQTTAECDAVLRVSDTSQLRERTVERLAFLRLVTSSNYEQMKANHSASVPGYFDGNYNQFEEKRRQEFESEQFNKDLDESRSLFTSKVAEGAIPAWRDCMLQKGSNLVAYVRELTDSHANIFISWKSDANVALKDVDLSLSAGVPDAAQLQSLRATGNSAAGFQGETIVRISRTQANGTIIGSVSGKANGVSKVFPLRIPAAFAVIPCGSGPSKVYQINAGSSTAANVEIPRATCPRTVRIVAQAASLYEQSGDPSLTVGLHVDGPQICTKTEGVPAPPTLGRARCEVSRDLPAGRSMQIRATHSNRRARAIELNLQATVSSP